MFRSKSVPLRSNWVDNQMAKKYHEYEYRLLNLDEVKFQSRGNLHHC
jgi:hypothetical protein